MYRHPQRPNCLLRAIFLALFLSSFSASATQVVIVDTDSSQQPDYTSLSAAVLAYQGALTEPLKIIARASSGVVDTQPVSVENYVTTASADLTIELEQGYTLYLTAPSNHSTAIALNTDFVTLRGTGGRILVDSNGFDSAKAVASSGQTAAAIVTVENLLLEQVGNKQTGAIGLYMESELSSHVIRNNVIRGFGDYGVLSYYKTYLYNNTLTHNYIGVGLSSFTGEAYNNLSVNNIGADYYQWLYWNNGQTGNNVSSDHTSPNEEGDYQRAKFLDYLAPDYALSTDDLAGLDKGADLSAATHPFNYDFDGDLRTGTWDVGAYEVDPATYDQDSDGMSDRWERLYGLNTSSDDGSLDPDLDGLSNLQEFIASASPLLADSDLDGTNDAQELDNATSPFINNVTRIVTVDTDPNQNADYLSLSEAIQDQKGVLTQPLVIHASASSGLVDVQAVLVDDLITGFETSLTIEFEAGYALSVSAEGNYQSTLNIESDFVTLTGKGGKLQVDSNGYTGTKAINVGGQRLDAVVTIENLFLEQVGNSDQGAVGINTDSPLAAHVIRNNVIFGFGDYGVFSTHKTYLYNNTLTHNNNGVGLSNFTGEAYNNLSVHNLTSDYYRWLYWDNGLTGNNVSSDSTSPNDDGDYKSPRFLDYLAPYYAIRNDDTSALDKGRDLSSALFSFNYDIEGVARTGAWDVGAYGADLSTYDQDNDGMSDRWERLYGLDTTLDDSALDPDSDGLTNLQEYQTGASPFLVDSEGDGFDDSTELVNGTSPYINNRPRIVIVDTDENQNPDYTNLAAAIAGEVGILTQPLTIVARASSGIADTQPVDLVGIQTGSELDVTIVMTEGYVLDVTAIGNYQNAITNDLDYVNIVGEGGKIQLHGNGYNGHFGIYSGPSGPDGKVFIEGLHIEGDLTGLNDAYGIKSFSSTVVHVIRNNVVEGFAGAGDSKGLRLYYENYVYNNTLAGNDIGVSLNSTTGELINNLSVDSVSADYQIYTDLVNTTVGTNISSDSSSPNVNLRDTVIQFVNVAASDYRLGEVNPVAIDQGANLSQGSYPFSGDHAGELRQGAWDIGAFEYSDGTVVNQSPMITSDPILGVNEGELYAYTVDATDPEGGPLSYQVSGAPAGLSIDTATGELSWQTDYESFGSYALTITVADSEGLSATQTYTLDVVNVNRPPAIDSSPVLSAIEGQAYDYTVSANDPDGDTITFALINAPAGMTIDSTNGAITWSPSYDSSGTQIVAVSASDPEGMTDTQSYSLSVSDVNRAPSANDLAYTLDEDTSQQITMTGFDPDSDALTFNVTSQPINGSLIIAGDNVSYQPSANFYGADSFEYAASDGFNNSSPSVVTLNILPVNDAPFITSTPNVSASEGAVYSYQLSAIDIDGDTLSYSMTGPAAVNFDASSGLLSWSPGFDDAGSHPFQMAANDGVVQVTQDFTLVVENTNRAPRIFSTAPVSGTEGVLYQYQVGASDPDSGELWYSLAAAPQGMSIDQMGLISWAPTASQVGTFSFSVSVSDSEGLTDAENVNITIESSPNSAPVIDFNAKQRAYVNQPYDQLIGATDENNDALTYSGMLVPDGMTVDQISGEINWIPGLTQEGSHVITVAVSDGKGGIDQLSFTVTVFGDNLAVNIDTGLLPDADADKPYHYQMSSTGINSDYTFSLSASPQGMLIDPQSGELSWLPSTSDASAPISASDHCQASPESLENTFGVDFEMVEKWHWGDLVTTGNIVNTPLLVNLYDTNEDGVTNTSDDSYLLISGFETSSSSPGYLRAYNATTGAHVWTATTPLNNAYLTPAVGDLDGDGDVEIVTTGLLIFDHEGQQIASTPVASSGHVSLADLDADGQPEILYSGMVYDANLNELFAIADQGLPIAVDLDLNGTQEVIAQGGAWSHDGEKLWQSDISDRQSIPAVGNFDSDRYPEIVLVTNDSLIVVNHDGTLLWSAPKEGHSNGPPLVADIDGDGYPEIGIVTRHKYTVYETDGQFKWSIDISDGSSGSSGSTAFDFNGDGALEVVHGDEYYIRILDGITGSELWSKWHTSSTGHEYPLVADIDNDGHAELVVTAYRHSGNSEAIRGVYAYEPILDNWPVATRILNQHAYSVTNINENGTIPRIPIPSWLTHNSYRASVLVDEPPLSKSDLVVTNIHLSDENTLSIEVENLGNGSSGNAIVSVYSDYPELDSVALSMQTLSSVEGRSSITQAITLPSSSANIPVFYVKVQSPTGEDCNENNNVSLAHRVTVELHDQGSTIRKRTYLVNVKPNEAPVIVSLAQSLATEGDEYRYSVRQRDKNINDSFGYALVSGPSNAMIDPHSGELTWVPTQDDASPAINSFNECKSNGYSGEHFAIKEKWFWNTPTNMPSFSMANATPILSQLNDDNGDGTINNDDIPDVLVATYESGQSSSMPGVLRALNGETGEELWGGGLPTATARYAPAVADLDGDGLHEIIVNTGEVWGSNKSFTVYEHDGSEKYTGTGTWSHPYITDITGDGYLEFVYGGTLYNRNAVSGIGTGGIFSVAADLDIDGTKTLIGNGYVHDHTGSRDFTVGGEGAWGIPAFANFDNDPELEVLNIWPPNYNYGSERITVRNHDGSYLNGTSKGGIFSSWNVGGGNQGALYALADIDGDSIPEIVMATGTRIVVFEKDSTTKWSYPIDGNRYQGVTTFDFDGDGKSEVVHVDNQFLRIFRGDTGDVLVEYPHPYQGRFGNPVVADVDGDGQAEIIAVMHDSTIAANNGVKVFEAKYQNWSHTRSHWNHAFYNAGAIDHDGNVLKVHDPIYNSFLENPITSFQADLTPEGINLHSDWGQLDAQIYNRGMRASRSDVLVKVYEGMPINGGVLVGQSTLKAIKPGQYQNIEISLGGLLNSNMPIYVVVDEDQVQEECDTNNNAQLLHRFTVNVTDDRGLSDEQSFIVSAHPKSIPPVFEPVNSLRAETHTPFSHTLIATDANPNDRVTYDLEIAPVGLVINKLTGELNWTPEATDQGAQLVRAVATDKTGNIASVNFTVEVAPSSNSAPEVTSTPVTDSEINQLYTYQLSVNDADGDAITYTMRDFESGMSMSSTGLLQWTPTQDQAGDAPIVVAVSDGYWNVEHSFILNVTLPSNNSFPEVTSVAKTEAVVASAYQYQVTATDADNDTLTFSLIDGPASMVVDSSTGMVTWTPTITQVGVHNFYARVSDGKVYTLEPITIRVWEAIQPLKLHTSLSPNSIGEGESLEVSLSATGGFGVRYFDLLVDGVSVVLDSTDNATLNGYGIGAHTVQTTVSDDSGSVVEMTSFIVRDPLDIDLPVAEILSPSYDARLTSIEDVIGTASDENLLGYRILISEKDKQQWREISSNTVGMFNGILGSVDPTHMLNGLYDLILEVTDINGQVAYDSTLIRIDSDLKVGNFSFTVEDVSIPMMGLPIRLTRTYDTRRKHEPLDFGYGWSVGYQDVKVEESRVPGEGWGLNEYASGPFGVLSTYCVEPLGKPYIQVTLPTGDVESFDVTTSPSCTKYTPSLDVEIAFNATGDTQSKLKDAGGSPTLRLIGDHLEILGDGQAYDPDQYELTTQSGYIYYLDQNFGVTRIEGPNGHTLTYNDSGIHHSAGKSIFFSRDSEGRIEGVTDPAGNSYAYSFDGQGDLVEFEDSLSNITEYDYNTTHGLTEIRDPLGRSIVRNIYDDDGRLEAQEDSDGNRTEFNHDIAGRQSIVTDRRNNLTVYYYDDEGNVTSEVNALNEVTTYTYDENGNQLSKTNDLGQTESASYDDRNNQLTQTDALGNTVAFTYNPRGQELTIEDARGNVYENSYDSVGNLLTVMDPLGNIAGNNINAQGLVTLTRDVAGNETTYTYDTDGNKLTETDAEANVTSYSYDTNGNVLSEARTRTIVGGAVITETTTFEYDSLNRLLKTIYPDLTESTMEYDAVGNQVASIDQQGYRTEYDYDVYGRLLTTRYHDGTTSASTYDEEGNKLTDTDRNGLVMHYTYDDLNRLIRTTYPDLSYSETVYDAAGRVSAEIDVNGNQTEYSYDAAGRRTAVQDALNQVHTFNYDADGNLIEETDARNNTITYTINELDQKTQTTFMDNTFIQEGFDLLGRRTSQTDQASKVTAYTYDGLGRLTTVTDALLHDTTFTYDEAGNKLTQTDAENRTTTWSYDSLGRVVSRTLPEGQVESFTYDDAGNMASHTDFNNQLTTFTYDSNHQVTRIDYYDASFETFTYDDAGNRKTAINSEGTTSYDYDSRNRLVKQTQANGTILDYEYDNVGNKTKLTTTIGLDVSEETYTYDALNRLATVTDANSGLTTYGYDEVGNRTSISYPNGTSITYVYDNLNRLTQVNHYNSSGAMTQQFDYTLHDTGRREQIDELSGRRTAYTYDDLYRLTDEVITDATNGNYSANYQFDNVGNRTRSIIDGVTTAYAYDDNDRITSQGGTSYTYDDNGNTLTESIDSDVMTYTYDAKNKLTGFEKLASGTTTNSSYTYNADGIRTSQTVEGTETKYVVDSNRDYAQVILELDDSDNVLVQYTYGDDLISQVRGTETSYYHYDGLGSTRALSNGAGEFTDTYNYEAFGALLNSTGSSENSYLFTGEQWDQFLGQQYLRARYYDSGIARFTQQDSWLGVSSVPVTLHKYLYANADPGNMVDPTGNFSMASVMHGVSITGQLATTAQRFTSIQNWQGLVSRSVASGGLVTGLIKAMEPGFLLRQFAIESLISSRNTQEWNAANDIYKNAGAYLKRMGGIGSSVVFALDDARKTLGSVRSVTKSLTNFEGIISRLRKGESRKTDLFSYILKVNTRWQSYVEAARDGEKPSIIIFKMRLLKGSLHNLIEEGQKF